MFLTPWPVTGHIATAFHFRCGQAKLSQAHFYVYSIHFLKVRHFPGHGRKNMARRKVNNGEKSPWGQRLTRPVPNGRRRSRFWLVPENFCVFLPNQKPERRRPFGTCLVRHCPQGIFSPFFTFLRAIFFRLFRLSLAPPLSASGSPRMFPGKIDNIPLPRVFSWSFSPATIEFQKSPVRPLLLPSARYAGYQIAWLAWLNSAMRVKYDRTCQRSIKIISTEKTFSLQKFAKKNHFFL